MGCSTASRAGGGGGDQPLYTVLMFSLGTFATRTQSCWNEFREEQ